LDPSDLAILEDESGLEALVTEAGSDTLFVFDFVSDSPPSFPDLPSPNPAEPGSSPLPETPLVVVVVPLTGGLPEEGTAFPASGGDDPGLQEDEVTVAASQGPDPIEALRHLPLSGAREAEAGPLSQAIRQAPLPGAVSAVTASDPILVKVDPVPTGTEPLWEDMSWLDPPPPASPDGPASPQQPPGDPAVLPARSSEQNEAAASASFAQAEQSPIQPEAVAAVQAGMKESAGHERSAQQPAPPDWTERILELVPYIVTLLAAFALPWWRWAVHREGEWRSRLARALLSFRRREQGLKSVQQGQPEREAGKSGGRDDNETRPEGGLRLQEGLRQ
jgi:hypothetical protein